MPHSVPRCAAAVHAGTGSTSHRPVLAPRLRWRPRPPIKGCAANQSLRVRSHSARGEPRSQGFLPPRRPGPAAPVAGLVTAGVGRGAPPGKAHLLGRGEPRSAARPQHGSERRPARPAGRRLARVLPAPPPSPLQRALRLRARSRPARGRPRVTDLAWPMGGRARAARRRRGGVVPVRGGACAE